MGCSLTRPCSDPLRSPTAAPGAEGVPAQSRGAVRTRLLARSGVENLEASEQAVTFAQIWLRVIAFCTNLVMG